MLDMTTYILENHVHILKYFIQLKYYAVNCLKRACVSVGVSAGVCVCVCVCVFVHVFVRVRLFSKFKQ